MFFYLEKPIVNADLTSIPSHISRLPLLAMTIAFMGYSIGYAAIPYVVMGEMLPDRTRYICSAISGSFNLVSMFLLLMSYECLAKWMGFHGVFWMFSGFNLIGVIFVFFLLPETKGKTLKEIQRHFT